MAIKTVEVYLEEWHQILVLVNDSERGGAGGTVGWLSNGGPDWREVAIHELGHSAFGLADEYDYGGKDKWSAAEPSEPNVSAVLDPTKVKWNNQLSEGFLHPTKENPDCTKTDPGPSGVPADFVGTFEGAKYSRCNIFRPTWDCMMRNTSAKFCPVCTAVIRTALAPFVPGL